MDDSLDAFRHGDIAWEHLIKACQVGLDIIRDVDSRFNEVDFRAIATELSVGRLQSRRGSLIKIEASEASCAADLDVQHANDLFCFQRRLAPNLQLQLRIRCRTKRAGHLRRTSVRRVTAFTGGEYNGTADKPPPRPAYERRTLDRTHGHHTVLCDRRLSDHHGNTQGCRIRVVWRPRTNTRGTETPQRELSYCKNHLGVSGILQFARRIGMPRLAPVTNGTLDTPCISSHRNVYADQFVDCGHAGLFHVPGMSIPGQISDQMGGYGKVHRPAARP